MKPSVENPAARHRVGRSFQKAYDRARGLVFTALETGGFAGRNYNGLLEACDAARRAASSCADLCRLSDHYGTMRHFVALDFDLRAWRGVPSGFRQGEYASCDHAYAAVHFRVEDALAEIITLIRACEPECGLPGAPFDSHLKPYFGAWRGLQGKLAVSELVGQVCP